MSSPASETSLRRQGRPRVARRGVRIAALAIVPLLLVAAVVPEVATAVTTGPVAANGAAYPPSCLSAPLVDTPPALSYRQSTKLAQVNLETSEYQGFETVDFTFWRVACEGGRSALLVRIARALNADPTLAVQFPFSYGLVARQAGHTATIRLAQEPNTRTASLQPGALIASALTLVVENVPHDADFPGLVVPSALPPDVPGSTFDFNKALDVTIPNPQADGISPPPPALVLSIPAYDPTAFPEASAPMPMSGYNAGNYFDPGHAGEGMIVEVGDRGPTDSEPSRYVSLAWFTYDADGKSFWLFGLAPFVPGVRAVSVPMSSFGGGGFAGDFGATSAQAPWGTVSIAFPDCASMHFEYASRAGLQSPLPSGAGERTWVRLTGTNGLRCD